MKAKAKQGINSLFLIGKQIFSHFWENKPSSWEKHHSITLPTSSHPPSTFLLLSPSCYCCTWHHILWDKPLDCLGHLSRLSSHSASCARPASLLAGQREMQKRPWLSVSTSQQQLKHWCVTNTVLIMNSKASNNKCTVSLARYLPTKLLSSFPSWERQGEKLQSINQLIKMCVKIRTGILHNNCLCEKNRFNLRNINLINDQLKID